MWFWKRTGDGGGKRSHRYHAKLFCRVRHREVNFIPQKELDKEHKAMPHGGKVLRTGTTGQDTQQVIEYNLALASNPEFTASVLVAYARACVRLAQEGHTGAMTVLDIAPKYLSPLADATLRRDLL